MGTSDRPTVGILVTDLDNTLWDWFGAWHSSFSAMLMLLTRRTGIDQAQLEREIRQVHMQRGTCEYSYLLNELPSLRGRHGGEVDLLREYDEVIHTLNKERKRQTRLYDGVLHTLLSIRAMGIPVVGYTESVAYWTEWRVRHLGVDGVLDVLYSSPDHDWPDGVDASAVRKRPVEEYGLRATEHRHVPPGVTKPDTVILTTILQDYGVEPSKAVYIGDSLTKDVQMAQKAGVHDVHAAYGVADGLSEYALLRNVSHWPDHVIERERLAARGTVVKPTYTVKSFDQILTLFKFEGESRLA